MVSLSRAYIFNAYQEFRYLGKNHIILSVFLFETVEETFLKEKQVFTTLFGKHNKLVHMSSEGVHIVHDTKLHFMTQYSEADWLTPSVFHGITLTSVSNI